jgi:predicted DNA-binding transcriptional regulator AlpA
VERPELLDAVQVGALLGVSDDTVKRYDSAGRLPRPLRLSDATIRWRYRELVDWVDAGCPRRDAWERHGWEPSHLVELDWLIKHKRDEAAAILLEVKELLGMAERGQELVRVRT